jgi:hypothetical protein
MTFINNEGVPNHGAALSYFRRGHSVIAPESSCRSPLSPSKFRETTSYLPLSDRLMRVTMSSQACSSLAG